MQCLVNVVRRGGSIAVRPQQLEQSVPLHSLVCGEGKDLQQGSGLAQPPGTCGDVTAVHIDGERAQ
jgi:hypothetical protein